MASNKTIYWHDYETFGSDPRRDRPCQFAGIRTDEDLNVIGEPLVIYCQPAPDFVPQPEACLVTGISPQLALEKGVSEAEFCASIIKEFSQPGTCVAGYNSIRFDDEVTRHLLYRCFYDAYEREWKNGNSRWDIIDLLRLTHALRPEGINWPKKEDGSPSFRLEELTVANGIGHEAAHDALSDVLATIAVAKLVKEKQPRLYDYYYVRRQKNQLIPMLDLSGKTPLLHVSSMYPASQGCMAMVLPLAQHPKNANGVIVYDLAQDPQDWLNLSVEEIRYRLFTARVDLPEGVERIGLKTVHVNKCPALAPLSVLSDEIAQRYDIDLDLCKKNQAILLNEAGLARKIASVFSEAYEGEETNPDLMLYSGGFFDGNDKGIMTEIRNMSPENLSTFSPYFHDKRLTEMLFRYRGRNFPGTLDNSDKQSWDDHCRLCLTGPEGLDSLDEKLTELEATVTPDKLAVLSELRAYAASLRAQFGIGA